MKICNRCKKELPFIFFYKDNSSKDGHKSVCKSCNKVQSSKHYTKQETERRGKGSLPLLIHFCNFCNKEFLAKPLSRKRQFCSKSCQVKASFENRISVKKKSLCIICRGEFVHYGERIVCGRKCLAIYLSEQRLGENNPAFNPNKKITKKCENCNKYFSYGKGGTHGERKFCSLQCLHIFSRGKSKDGGPLKYLNPYPIEFAKIKKYIKERDNFVCILCASVSGKLHVHHIDYNKQNNQEENLITLCFRCHMLTNFQRDFWKIVFASILSGSRVVKKGWGIESHITNNNGYCLKYLIFFKDKQFSFHKHNLKKELWHCLLGEFECVLQNGEEKDYHIFKKGEKIEIKSGILHQLRALENSIIIEVSTADYSEDSIRMIKGD